MIPMLSKQILFVDVYVHGVYVWICAVFIMGYY